MTTLDELIARFEREHPEEMKEAREALKATPLTRRNILAVPVDITDIMLMHEVNNLRAEVERLRAELAECRRENDVLRGKLAMSELPCAYCGLAKEEWGKCPYGFPGCGRADDAVLLETIDASLAAKGE